MTETGGRRLFSLHLSMVARIALGTAVAAALVLGLVLLLAVDHSGTTYAELVQAHSITRRNLGPAFLVGGLVLAVVVALSTWLICLYSSFRVAGPLYRFTRNLEQASAGGKPLDIRRDDCLQDLSTELKGSLEHLQAQHHELEGLAREGLRLIEVQGESGRADLQEILDAMETVANRARLD